MEKTIVHIDALIEECKRGNRKAQFELYQKYNQAMYHICLRMLRNECDAEDVLQTAFVDVFTKLDTYLYQSTIGYWIKRIVINNCINFLKKRRLVLDELQEQHIHITSEVNDDDEGSVITVPFGRIRPRRNSLNFRNFGANLEIAIQQSKTKTARHDFTQYSIIEPVFKIQQ